MAHAGRTGYDNREIVMKYIHYKLSQRGYEWGAGEAGAAPPGAAPAPGIFSSQPGLTPQSAAPRDPAARTSPPPPPAAAAAAAGPALSPVPPVVHLTLRQAGDDFSRRYRRDFAEMSSQLHLTPFTARGRFATVVEELFRDGVNWGRIVAFFEFGGVMCVESVNREMSPLVDNIALWMTEYLNRHLHTWIQDNGGWGFSVCGNRGENCCVDMEIGIRFVTEAIHTQQMLESHRGHFWIVPEHAMHFRLPDLYKTPNIINAPNYHTTTKAALTDVQNVLGVVPFLKNHCRDAFVELYGPSVQPLFDFSWLSLKTLLSLALVGACITLGAYLGHK